MNTFLSRAGPGIAASKVEMVSGSAAREKLLRVFGDRMRWPARWPV